MTSATGSDRVERMFDLDAFYEGMISGRFGGASFDPETTQCLLVLLERLDWTADAREIAGALPHVPVRFGVDEMRSTLAKMGFSSTELRLAGARLAAVSRTALIRDADGSLWLPEGSGSELHLVRPGDFSEETARIDPRRTYRVIEFEPQARGRDVPDPRESWLEGTLGRFEPELWLLLLLTLLSGGLAIVTAFGITAIFNTVVPTRNVATLAAILVGLCLVFATDFGLRRIRADVVGQLSGRIEYLLGAALLGKLLKLPAAMVTGVPLGDQIARLRQFESTRDLFGGPVFLLALDLPIAGLLLVAVAVIAWPLALVLAVHAVIVTVLGSLITPSIRRAARRQNAAQSVLNRTILEALEQRGQIGREGLADVWTRKIDRSVRMLSSARRHLAASTRWLDALAQASVPLAAGSTIGLGAVLAMDGRLSGGALIAVTILTWRIFAPVQQGLLLMPKLKDMLALFRQIDAMMRLPEEDAGAGGGRRSAGTGTLSAQGIVLRYPKSVAPALAGVGLDIPGGALVAVAGRSGSGKTTLLRVLAGQLSPQAGAILFDGTNVTQTSRAFRARTIAYVSQSPLFIYGTVAQNLRLADPSADDARLLSVTDEIGLGDWVAGLPDGIDTRLDPSVDGAVLGAGVLTSLSVAQALLMTPAVLLLDEVAGNMDMALETRLIAALEARRGRMTSIFVTHRPSLIRRADKVIEMNAGSATMRDTDQQMAVAS